MKTKLKARLNQPVPWLHLLKRRELTKPKMHISSASVADLAKTAKISRKLAETIKAEHEHGALLGVNDLASRIKLSSAVRARLENSVVFPLPGQINILSVKIDGERLFSGKPYAFQIDFVPAFDGEVTMARMEVKWKGRPFEVQQLLSPEESKKGSVILRAGKEHALPPGPVELTLTLYDAAGGASSYLLDEWGYPSNPFSLFLSPSNRSIYNGSVRPDWDGTNWNTGFNFTLLNGDNVTVRLQRNMVWKFWDGGVGGSLVDSGTWTWGTAISVGPYGSVGGWFSVSAPPGNNIFKKYEGKEDMTFELIFTKSDGTPVTATITCRIMGGWGINIIMVGSYSAAEQTTISNGIADARNVYENFGLTFSSVDFWSISNAQAGGYTVLNDDDEFDDLVDDWTVPGNSVDCFVVRGFYASVAGLSPAPGPDGKDGTCESDGLAVSNSMVCLAHELGHYMGGHDHADSLGRDNVMHSICGGRQFTYDQYKKFFNHGFTRIVR
ncbi:MAG: hypothetical protein IPJ02_01640 [Chitinophagaceae bacterium]|nr:hypothetical protein [Chitinophagaceae bacterium]